MLPLPGNEKAPDVLHPGLLAYFVDLMFAMFALKWQEASRKTKHQQPVANDERTHRKFNPCWRVGADADDGGVWIICQGCDQTCEVVVPAGQDGGEDRDDRESHQVAEVFH